jgi:sigma-B regulation protein RsbU (phosphoserine phosphatase)
VEVRSELAVPLVYKDRLVGVLDLESVEYNAFTEQHEQMLSTLSAYIAVALENARLYQKLAEDESRLEHELETAREIQKGLLPRESPPAVPGLDLAAAYRPARQLGGDFYDFLPYGPDRLAVVVGDVAGKGTGAALYGALAVGMLRGLVVESRCHPAEMLTRMNRQMAGHHLDNRFVALLFAVYDAAARRLTVANAGFTRPLLVRGGRVEELAVTGQPLGLLPEARYDAIELDLQPDDMVLFCSDGIAESTDRSAEEFGVRRLRARLIELVGSTAREVAEGLLQSAERYVTGAGTEVDDRTVVVVKVR